MTDNKEKMPLLLSLDDEWIHGLREIYLYDIGEALRIWAEREGVEVALVATQEEAADRLKMAHKEQQPVALLLLDVMLHREPKDDLKDFGSDDALLRMDAGWQIASLLQTAKRPAWVRHAANASVLFLTGNAASAAAMRAYRLVPSDAMATLNKALCEPGGRALTDALDKALSCWKRKEARHDVRA